MKDFIGPVVFLFFLMGFMLGMGTSMWLMNKKMILNDVACYHPVTGKVDIKCDKIEDKKY